MKSRTKWGLAAVGLIAVAILFFAMRSGDSDDGEAPVFVRMVSGPAGGSWYPLGAKIAQVLEQEITEIATSSGPGGGVSNVKDINQRNAEIGFSYANTTYDGYMGRGKYREAQTNVRHFATLYPAAFQAAVRRDSAVRTYADLKDKHISPGKAGWSGTVIAEAVLKAYGITFDSIRANGGTVHYVDYADSVALMKDGHIDAFLGVTSVPQASFIDLNFKPGIRFLSIDDEHMAAILASNRGFIRNVIPKTAYDGMVADVPTIGSVTVMLVHKDLPDDLVYRMAQVFWANHASFAEVKKVWNEVKLENALMAVPVPVHPGAQRYYDEVGVGPK